MIHSTLLDSQSYILKIYFCSGSIYTPDRISVMVFEIYLSGGSIYAPIASVLWSLKYFHVCNFPSVLISSKSARLSLINSPQSQEKSDFEKTFVFVHDPLPSPKYGMMLSQ